MRTTLNLNDALYRRAKIKAAQEGCTVSDLIEAGLQIALEAKPSSGTNLRRVPLPLIERGHPALPGQEMTPEKTAEVLLAQEVGWTRETK